MKGFCTHIGTWFDKIDGRFIRWQASLSQSARLFAILVILTLFVLGSLFTVGLAFRIGWGGEEPIAGCNVRPIHMRPIDAFDTNHIKP